MKKAVTFALVLLNSSAFADPSIFGMELGKMTEKDLKTKYNASHTGTNKYSDGNMYSVPVSSIDFDGLKEVTTIFSTDGKLVAVLTTLSKHKFDSSVTKKRSFPAIEIKQGKWERRTNRCSYRDCV
jgi:hypothetical protein